MRNRWFPPQGRNRKSTHKHPNSTSRQASTFRRYAGFHLLPETNQELVGQSHKPDFVYGTGYPIQSVFDSCGLTDCRIENAARPRRSHNRRCLDWMLASLADTIPCSCSLFHRSDTGWESTQPRNLPLVDCESCAGKKLHHIQPCAIGPQWHW